MKPMPDGRPEGPIDLARALAPDLAELGPRIEAERRLPAELVSRLIGAGLFHLLVPRSLGGGEIDPPTFSRVVEELARADASTAWCVVQASGCSLVSAYLDLPIAAAMFGPEARGILAWGPGKGTAVATEGGFMVAGRWAFASGCRHATWLGGVATIQGPDGRPRLDERGVPDIQTMIFPAARAALEDIWQVSGLRGTASDAFGVTDLFVPEALTLRRDDPTRRREAGPLYAFRTESIFTLGFASVALGIARGALDAFTELAGAKVPRGAPAVLRDNPVVRSELARAEATWGSARAFLREAVGEAWDAAIRVGEVTLAHRARIRLAGTHAIQMAAQALDVAYHHAGSGAILESNPFERRFRDLHAVTQQVQGRYTHYENVGRYLLGLEPDQTFL